MLSQIEAVARENRATAVHRVKVQIGPLSGVEPQLLQQAFPIAVAAALLAFDPDRQQFDVEYGIHGNAPGNRDRKGLLQ